MKNIYEDKISNTDNIELHDINLNTSLYDIVSKYRHFIGRKIEFYLIGGQTQNHELSLSICDYLVEKFPDTTFYVRGYLPLECAFRLDGRVVFSENSKLIYNSDNLKDMIINIQKQNVNKFLTRFVEHYFSFKLAYIPITELTLIGIKYEKIA